jgi:hypothetical protein
LSLSALMKKKPPRFLVKVFQGLGVIILSWLVLYELSAHRGATGFWEQLRDGGFRPSWGWLLAGILLMPVNWYLEVRKWQNFFAPATVPDLREGFRAVLGGISLSFLTPNRSGEYMARVLISPPGSRWPAVYAALGSAYCQMAVLLATGLPALTLFSAHLQGNALSGITPTLFSGLILFSSLVGIGFFFRPLLYFVERRGWSRFLGNWWAKITPLGGFSRIQMLRGLLLAISRYGIYAIQYDAMLRFSGIYLPSDAAFTGIATIYLIQTGLPLPPLLGFLARGEIALLIWQTWGADPLQILSASYGLFIINLAVPAFFFLWFKKFKNYRYDKPPL